MCLTFGGSWLIFIGRRKIWLAEYLEYSNGRQPRCQFHKVAAWILGCTLNGSIWLESHSSRDMWQCPDHSCRHIKKVSMLVPISLFLINNKKDDYLRFRCPKAFIKLLPRVGKGYYCLHLFARTMQLQYSGFPSRCLFKYLF